MNLTGVQPATCSLPAVSRLPSITQNSTRNCAAIFFSYGGLVRLGQASDTVPQHRHSHADRSRSSLDHIT